MVTGCCKNKNIHSYTFKKCVCVGCVRVCVCVCVRERENTYIAVEKMSAIIFKCLSSKEGGFLIFDSSEPISGKNFSWIVLTA